MIYAKLSVFVDKMTALCDSCKKRYLLLLHQEVFSTLDRMVADGHPPPSCRRGKDLGHPIFVFLRTREVLGDERSAILVSFAIPRQSFCRPLPFPILWSLGKV